jgi:hypothetical protein
MTYGGEEEQMPQWDTCIFTRKVAAQSLHGALDAGVVNLSQLFNHRYHRHTPCRGQKSMSAVPHKKQVWRVKEGKGCMQVSLRTPVFPNQRTFLHC